MDRPLWCSKSGRFFGWQISDYLFNAEGRCVGYVRGDVCHRLSGEGIAEFDGDYIGKRPARPYPLGGARIASVGIARVKHVNRVGRATTWTDPAF